TMQIELSRVLATRAEGKEAVAAAQRAAALDPSNERALAQLASTLADDRNEAALARLDGLLTRSKPDRPVTIYSGMRLAYLRGDFAQAIALGERLTASGADQENAARNFNLLGTAYESAGNLEGARKAFAASLHIAPRAAAAMLNAGYTELKA